MSRGMLLMPCVFVALATESSALNVRVASDSANGLMSSALWAALPPAYVDTFRALDADRSGFIEKNEIMALAAMQGVTTEDLLADLADVDVNRDGRLSFSELARILAGGDATDTGLASGQNTEQDGPAGVTEDVRSPMADSQADSSPQTLSAAVDTQQPSSEAQMLEATGSSRTVGSVRSADATQPGPDASSLARTEDSVEGWLAKASSAARQDSLREAAALFVESVAKTLERRDIEDATAEELETRATSLRGNATSLVRSAPALIEVAAREAVAAALVEPIAEAKRLQQQADAALRNATELRSAAQRISAKVDEDQKLVLTSVQQLSGGNLPVMA